MRYVGAFLAFILMQVAGAPLHAATLSQSKIGNWTLSAISNDSTGKFDYCAAWTTYQSNIVLGFAIYSDFSWAVTFRNQEWNLTTGTKYPVTLTIDRRAPQSIDSVATDANTVAVPMPDSADLFNAFAHGYRLTLATSAGANFEFILSDTAKVLPKLLVCVRAIEADVASQSSNPFAPAGGATTQQTANPAPQPAPQPAPTPAVLGASPTTNPQAYADVLSQAGLSGYTILSADQAKQYNADVAWQDGGILGTFITVAPGQNQTVQSLNNVLITTSQKSCTNGQFSSNSTIDPSEPKALLLSTTCAAGDQSVYSFYTILVASNGGFYIVLTFGPTADTQTTDAKVRNVIYNILEN